MTKSPCFRAKPATGLDVIGQNFALDRYALTVGQQGLQVGRSIDHGHSAFPRSAPAIRLRLESEPIMRMWAKRKHIRRLLDRAKEIAAKHLHRHTPDEARQVQRHGL